MGAPPLPCDTPPNPIVKKRPKPHKKRRPFPTSRYNGPHRANRDRLDPVVKTGTVPCVRCGELIKKGESWQLDHRDDGPGWLGPAHVKCNARAGWEKMVRNQANGNGSGSRVEREAPLTWSHRWYDEPPVGTVAGLEGGGVEVHVGRGVWVEA